MLSELHSLNLKLCSKQYNKKFVLHLIVVPQLGGGRRHNYSTKTRKGRPGQWAVYVFSYVYGFNKELFWARCLRRWKIMYIAGPKTGVGVPPLSGLLTSLQRGPPLSPKQLGPPSMAKRLWLPSLTSLLCSIGKWSSRFIFIPKFYFRRHWSAWWNIV